MSLSATQEARFAFGPRPSNSLGKGDASASTWLGWQRALGSSISPKTGEVVPFIATNEGYQIQTPESFLNQDMPCAPQP
jgi:hypothetical protein